MSVDQTKGELPLAPNHGEVTIDLICSLPEEIWMIIFKYFDTHNSQHLGNLCIASCYLNNLLGPLKTTFLFNQILPNIFHKLNKTAILNCRLVCKSWNQSVDNFLENHISRRPFEEISSKDETINNCRVFPLSPRISSLANMELEYNTVLPVNWSDGEADAFRLCRENHFRNPFIGRSLLFRLDHEMCFLSDGCGDVIENLSFTAYWRHGEQFLKTLGHHIWYFKIVDWSNQQRPQTFYTRLVRCLKFLPNVRALHLSVSICDRFLDYKNFDANYVSSFAQEDPLPELSFLKTVSLNKAENTAKILIYDQIIKRYANQLEKLEIASY